MHFLVHFICSEVKGHSYQIRFDRVRLKLKFLQSFVLSGHRRGCESPSRQICIVVVQLACLSSFAFLKEAHNRTKPAVEIRTSALRRAEDTSFHSCKSPPPPAENQLQYIKVHVQKKLPLIYHITMNGN